jgi:hypothetical protein
VRLDSFLTGLVVGVMLVGILAEPKRKNVISNEDFMKQLEEEFPGEDWDNLPDIETLPDVFTVHGYQMVDSPPSGKFQGKFGKQKTGFTVHKEYPTRQEAEVGLGRNRKALTREPGRTTSPDPDRTTERGPTNPTELQAEISSASVDMPDRSSHR